MKNNIDSLPSSKMLSNQVRMPTLKFESKHEIHEFKFQVIICEKKKDAKEFALSPL